MRAFPRTHTWQRRWICYSILMLSLTSQSNAEPQHYMVVVQDIDYYPIYRADPSNNRYSGYMADLMTAFADHAGIEFSYHVRPIRRMTLEYTAGMYDFAVPDNPNWNTQEKQDLPVTYTNPLLTFEDAMYVAADNDQLTPDDMRDIGTITGFTPWKFQGRIESGQVELKTARKPANLIRMALAGNVETFNLAAPVARHQFEALSVGDRLVQAPKLMENTVSHYHLSTIKHPGVITQFNRFLEEHEALVQSLRHQYGLEKVATISRWPR